MYTVFYQYPRFNVDVRPDRCVIQSLTNPGHRCTIMGRALIGNNDDYEDRAVHDGTKFRGNTILIKTINNQHYWIGDEIWSFIMPHGEQIEEFHSPMGNNDVPYAFARTDLGRWLLFLENISFLERDVPDSIKKRNFRSPYAMYYESKPRRRFWDWLMNIKPSLIRTSPLNMRFVPCNEK